MSVSPQIIKLTAFIALLAAVGQMTQTMYVPSIGYMVKDFAVSPASLQAVMACFLIPYGFSQFIYGPLSDRYGRKPIILFGLLVYVVGSLVALFANSYDLFLFGSFVQGLGIGCGGAMARTLTRDLFDGEELHKVNGLISMCLIFSPLIAPVLGGFLTEHFNWRASYLFLALFSIAVTIVMMTKLSETLPKEKRRQEKVIHSYRHVLSNQCFQGYVICLVATFAGLAIFEAAAGVLLGGVLQLPATTVSLLFVLPIPGYLVGAGLSSYLTRKWNERKAMYLGILFLASGSAVILIPGVITSTSAVTLVGGATIYFLGAGILFPAATTGALSPFPNHAGTGGAVLGGLQNLGAGMATLIASVIPTPNQTPLGALMLFMTIVALLGLSRIYRHKDAATDIPAVV